MKFKLTTLILAFAFLLSSSYVWSQSQTPLDIALRHIEQNFKKWELTQEDVSDMAVSDMYQSKHNGLTHIYFKQRYNGIALQNAILNLNITEDGKVLYVGKRFFPNLNTAVNATSASISSDQALQMIFNDLNISKELPRSTQGENENLLIYDNTGIAQFEINVELTYKNIDNNIFLAWNSIIAPVGSSDMWNYSIDATNGQIIEKRDMVVRCSFKKDAYHRHNDHCGSESFVKKPEPSVKQALIQTNTSAAGSYRVFALPTESPNHGPHELVTDPADATASPFGWHDTDGDIDPEYTITRGNNVYAYEDRDGNGSSDGTEPDGGASLIFDYPYTSDGEAIDNIDAAVTNLFYMNNMMHDFSYTYGFDEAAGNFQRNTYGNGGAGNDEVIARAQADVATGQLDNANFSTPPDGFNGSMNMYVWDNPGNKVFTVTAPTIVAGQYVSATAQFGPPITDIPISGEVVEVEDDLHPFTDGCDNFVNASELQGKIALIDRGVCFFETKVVNAEAAGAIAVIVCNFEIDPEGMGATPDVDDPNIPSIMIGSADCDAIRVYAGNGLEVTLVTPPANSGPDFLDGDFDNGIIAHEYAHGISIRLTSGPSESGCVDNTDTGEAPGEGWSDFFSLVTTVKPGDDGATGRGVATYVQRQDLDGIGLRDYRYSTDMNVNPLTYADVGGNPQRHARGTVWATILWDLYWAMVDEHGFDNDQWTGTGGNNMTIQLVMDGMKIQPCNPGFVDARDAILEADTALYNGANGCLIWEVFARRGVGYSADQGTNTSGTDQIESFDPLPTCIPELKIRKTVTPLVNAGDDIDVTVVVTNHKTDATLTNIVVTDELVGGTNYVTGSVSGNVTEGGVSGGMVTFELGTMEYLDEITFTYKLSTDDSNFSIRHFHDDVENTDDEFWFSIPIQGNNYWDETTADANSPATSWYVQNIVDDTEQILQAGQPLNQTTVQGDVPVIRFYQKYNTESGADGGILEISTDDGNVWSVIADDFFRNPPAEIQYSTFAIPGLRAFSGNSSNISGNNNGWIASYADLSAYAGQDIIFRFRFSSDDNTVPNGLAGWWVDDIEIMDMINYNGEACVTSDQGDQACATADERGTIIESEISTSTKDPVKTVFLNVFPNPTDDVINFSISSLANENVTISLMTLDGREVGSKAVGTSTTTQTFSMDVSDLPSGFYLVKASTNHDVTIEKVVIH